MAWSLSWSSASSFTSSELLFTSTYCKSLHWNAGPRWSINKKWFSKSGYYWCFNHLMHDNPFDEIGKWPLICSSNLVIVRICCFYTTFIIIDTDLQIFWHFLLLNDCLSCSLYEKLIYKLSAKILKTPKNMNKFWFLMVFSIFWCLWEFILMSVHNSVRSFNVRSNKVR